VGYGIHAGCFGDRRGEVSVIVKNLPNNPKSGVVLYCPFCAATFSALRADYFFHPPDEALMHCGTPMALVRKSVLYEPLTLEEAEDGQTD
jgi:hypothetical protein